MPISSQVHQHLVHLRVADALADSERSRMHAVAPATKAASEFGDRHAAIAVAVPIDANLLAAGLHHFLDDEPHQSVITPIGVA